jgi:NAD(P)-dependent dehydrogenase (short-subunit alcohol dehydrogenase family)
MARGILFLVSDEDSSYMTGGCLRIDGGHTLTH